MRTPSGHQRVERVGGHHHEQDVQLRPLLEPGHQRVERVGSQRHELHVLRRHLLQQDPLLGCVARLEEQGLPILYVSRFQWTDLLKMLTGCG